jgi:hypothetical protein
LLVAAVCWVLLTVALPGQQPADTPSGSPALSFEFFKAEVEPIFLKKRPEHARCVACHGQGTPLRLQPLQPGHASWTEEESQKNFSAIRRVAAGGLKSRLLLHPLAEAAGGDFYHNGGKHFSSQNDPEWLTLKAFVLGQTAK